MEIKTSKFMREPYRSGSYDDYFSGLSVMIFDIETTGLYPPNSQVILGGMLNLSDPEIEVTQYFAETKAEETELLHEYCGALAKADVLISYNGSSFDLPFLRQRLAIRGSSIDLEALQSFDLYRAIRNHSRFRDFLPDLKQKTVEAYLGVKDERADQIDGAMSVRLYEDYIGTGSPPAKEKILLHNRDDLLQLSALLKVLDKLDLHKILHFEGFTAAKGEKRCFTRELSIQKNVLKAEARTRNIFMDYYSFDPGFQAVHLADRRSLTIEVPLEKLMDALVLDLNSINLDFSALEKYPCCHDGYLILAEKGIIHYAEVNHLVRIFLQAIMELV